MAKELHESYIFKLLREYASFENEFSNLVQEALETLYKFITVTSRALQEPAELAILILLNFKTFYRISAGVL